MSVIFQRCPSCGREDTLVPVEIHGQAHFLCWRCFEKLNFFNLTAGLQAIHDDIKRIMQALSIKAIPDDNEKGDQDGKQKKDTP